MFRECPLLSLEHTEQVDNYKEISLSISSPQLRIESSNQADGLFSAGGSFAYRYEPEKSGLETRNRFIVWRVIGNILELVELSLDFNLRGNSLRIHFPVPIHPQVLFLEKIDENPAKCRIYIFVLSCAATLHRLCFDHPKNIHRGVHGHGSYSSIFARADASMLQPYFPTICRSSTPSTMALVSESCVAFGCNNGSVILSRLRSEAELVEEFELKEQTMMKRLWGGFMPAFTRGSSGAVVNSVEAHTTAADSFIFVLGADQRLRSWSANRRSLLGSRDVASDAADNAGPLAGRLQMRLLLDSRFPAEIRLLVHFPGARAGVLLTYVLVLGAAGDPVDAGLESVRLCGEQSPLLTFALSRTHIWTLWTVDNRPVVRCAPLRDAGDGQPTVWDEWLPLSEPGLLDDNSLQLSDDVQAGFLNEIFAPGRFSSLTVYRALNMFRTGVLEEPDSGSVLPLDYQSLREGILLAIDAHAKAAISSTTVTGTALDKLLISLWHRLWDLCVQSHRDEHTCLGLCVHEYCGIIGIVKKGGIGFLRPMDPVESLSSLVSQAADVSGGSRTQQLLAADEIPLATGDNRLRLLASLIGCAAAVTTQLGPVAMGRFEEDLFRLIPPREAADLPLQQILSGNTAAARASAQEKRVALNFTAELLRRVARWPGGGLAVLETITAYVVHGDPPPQRVANDQPPIRDDWLAALFASSVAEHVAASGYQQLITVKFGLARDMFLLFSLLQKLSRSTSLTADEMQKLTTVVLPQLEELVKTSFVMKWLGLQLMPPLPTQLEANISALDLTAKGPRGPVPMYDYTVVQVYYRELLPLLMKQEFTRDSEVYGLLRTMEDPIWDLVRPLLNIFIAHLWVSKDRVQNIIPFILVMIDPYGQAALVQEFLRLLNCQQASLDYLLGRSHLVEGDFEAAKKCFSAAAAGIAAREPFLLELCRRRSDSGDERETEQELLQRPRKELLLRYYLAVIQHFDTFRQSLCVIDVAKFAIAEAMQQPPDEFDGNTSGITEMIAVLYANIFKHSLALPQKRYEDAFNALLNNPDPNRQSDCLRRFVVVLCEDGQLERLCSLPFGSLLEAVDRVLYDKATKLDVAHSNPNYYDVLFAFHTFRGHYRQAATIMVEYAQRLGVESHAGDLETLQRQANCYLAALNTFKFLPDPRDAWTVHVSALPHVADSPKRKRDIQLVGNGQTATAHLLELRDMEKEYWLIRSHLLLHRRTRSVHTLKLGPSETYALLIQHGCFDTALTLAQLHQFPQRDIELLFDALTKRCLQLQLHSGDANLRFEEEWLDTLAEEFSDRSGSAWGLLGNWLQRYDGPETNYGLHTHVAEKVLLTDVRIRLPHWLVSRLQDAHPAALLRIYLHFDLLDDAGLCAAKLLGEAALRLSGDTKGPSQVFVPYTQLDQLLGQLKHRLEDNSYQGPTKARVQTIYQNLQRQLGQYLATVSGASSRLQVGMQT